MTPHATGAVADLDAAWRALVGAALLGRFLVDGPLGAALAPIGWSALERLLSADRDLEADRQAVTLQSVSSAGKT